MCTGDRLPSCARCANGERDRYQGEIAMTSVAKITELSVRSEKSFDDAIRVGIERASQTLRNVKGAWVKEQKVDVENGRIVAYQVILQITFVLE